MDFDDSSSDEDFYFRRSAKSNSRILDSDNEDKTSLSRRGKIATLAVFMALADDDDNTSPPPGKKAKISKTKKECETMGCTEKTFNRWCKIHKGLSQCAKEGCTRKPTFGILGHGPRYCKADKKFGMVDVKNTNNRKCVKCNKTSAAFGMEGGMATHCFKDALVGMVNVVSPRCKECTKQPYYGLPGKKAEYCKKHKKLDMVDVKSKKCKECNVIVASYGYKGGKAEWCADHKKPGMITVHHKMCHCGRAPSYGYEGNRPEYCKAHKKLDMVDVKHATCEDPECDKFPCYGYPGQPARRCAADAEPGMINVTKEKCEEPGCIIRASFGDEWGKPRRCFADSLPGMVNVVTRRCSTEDCDRTPYYGFEGGPIVKCLKHKEDGMIDRAHPKCEHGRQLSSCLGDICGKKIGGHSIQEFFATATYHVIKRGDDLDSYLSNIDRRIDVEGDTFIKPDYFDGESVVEFDGFYYHTDQLDNDLRKTSILVNMCIQVVRFRDRLPDVKGAVNFSVEALGSPKDLVEELCVLLGVAFAPQFFKKVDSLARRAINHLTQKGAIVQQMTMDDYM